MPIHSSEQEKNAPNIEKFIRPADISVVMCVDDRQHDHGVNGVEIPGGVYGIIDAIKRMTGKSEEEAWEFAIRHGIPIGAHIDDHTHGDESKGCGYAKLVEINHKAVDAVEAVPAADRLARVRNAGGLVVTYSGPHAPQYALINQRVNTSFTPSEAITEADIHAFSYDKWAAEVYGKQLGLDHKRFAADLEKAYRSTVKALSPIEKFEVIK